MWAELSLPPERRLIDAVRQSADPNDPLEPEWLTYPSGSNSCPGMSQQSAANHPPTAPVGKTDCPINTARTEVDDATDQYDLNLEDVRSKTKLNYAQQLNEGSVRSSSGSSQPETVYVLDTGVDGSSPDFAKASGGSRILPMYDAYSLKDELKPVDPSPEHHGTMVASVIAGGSNGYSRLGVAPKVLIKPIKVFCDQCAAPSSTFYAVAKAVAYVALTAGPRRRIVNWSGGWNPSPILLDTLVVLPLIDAGILVAATSIENMLVFGRALFVQSAGNCGDGDNNTQDQITWPTSLFFHHGTKLTVAAVNQNGTVSGFSTNNDQVDLAAAGVCVSVTLPTGATRGNGTSFAAPEVAGAAALLRGWAAENGYPDLKPSQIHEALVSTAKPVTRSRIAEGSGVLDAFSALATIALPPGSGRVTVSGLSWSNEVGPIQDIDVAQGGSSAVVLRDLPSRLEVYSISHSARERSRGPSRAGEFCAARQGGSRTLAG